MDGVGAVAGFLPAEEEMLKRVQHDNLILVWHDSLVCRATVWCGFGMTKIPSPLRGEGDA